MRFVVAREEHRSRGKTSGEIGAESLCAGEFIIGRVINLHASEGNLVPGFHYFEERGGTGFPLIPSPQQFIAMFRVRDGERATLLK